MQLRSLIQMVGLMDGRWVEVWVKEWVGTKVLSDFSGRRDYRLFFSLVLFLVSSSSFFKQWNDVTSTIIKSYGSQI